MKKFFSYAKSAVLALISNFVLSVNLESECLNNQQRTFFDTATRKYEFVLVERFKA